LLLLRIVATIDPENAASARVASKIGMIFQCDIMLAIRIPTICTRLRGRPGVEHAPAGNITLR
jgi:RimJ/RimL family protein N-acetyltransferase